MITELTKCLALNRILHGAGHWKLARSHANLAEAYLDLKGIIRISILIIIVSDLNITGSELDIMLMEISIGLIQVRYH